MSVILTLRSIKGSRLTNTEVDTNFSNISDELDLKAPLDNPEFTGTFNLDGSATITGDLTVQGTTTFVSSQSLSVGDNMIYVNNRVEAVITNASGDGTNVTYTADNNYSPGDFVTVSGVTPSSFNVINAVITAANSTTFTIADTNTDTYTSNGSAYAKTASNPDLGLSGGYNTDGTPSGYAHGGIFRDASDNGTWKFYEGYTPEPGSEIDTTHVSFSLANLAADTVTATDFNSTSDIKLKENIQVITNALDMIKQIEGVSFNWKDSGKASIGVVAQNVEQVIPTIVNTGSDGIKRVSYDSLIPILIEAVKELSAKLDK